MKPQAAAIYCRISSDPEGLRLGVTRQEEDCRELANRLGWTVAEVYIDNDVSASKGQRRPEFERMLAGCQDGQRDGILVYNTDRLTRRLVELATFLDWRERHQIAFATTEGDDTTTANGRMVIEIKGVVAQQEARRISERVTRAHLQLAQQGKLAGGGSRPFGYEQDRRTIRATEAELIRQLAERLIAGESLTSVCRSLEQDGVPAPGGGAKWDRGVVKRALTSPRMVGLREYRGEVMLGPDGPVKAEWPAILDMATWEAVGQVLSGRGDDPSRHRIDRSYLLSGFLRCPCGAKMYGITQRGRANYRCPTDRGCGSTIRRADPIDEHVTELMLRYLEGQELDEDEPDQAVPDLVDGDIELAEKSLANLINEWGAGSISDQVFFTAQAKKEAAINDLKGVRAQIRRRQVRLVPEGIRERWAVANLSQRRAILSQVILAVKVLPKPTNAPKRFDPQYYQVMWQAAD